MRIAIAIVLGLVSEWDNRLTHKHNPPLIRALRTLSSPDSFGLECFHPFSIRRMRAVRPQGLALGIANALAAGMGIRK